VGLSVEKLRTLSRLGFVNVGQVAAYRACLKLPFSAIRKTADAGAKVTGPFFKMTRGEPRALVDTALPKVFGYHDIGTTTRPPDWLANPINQQKFPNAQRPFYAIADFDPAVGDIKQLWELSRFQWVIRFAKDALENPEQAARLNDWIADWSDRNPAYRGPNWKCGQEAALRVLHLIMGAHILDQIEAPHEGLKNLVHVHLKRIAPTVSYAMAQDNNHGTSEAAALYIGGSWLSALGDPAGTAWARQGRRLLENRAAKLIAKDGSFSQYSVTYHRMMLDSLSLAEWWRARCGDAPFSAQFISRAKAASTWLYRLIDVTSGDVPNIGANDGAHILNLAEADYRDFRPSAALGYALWHGEAAFKESKHAQAQLALLNIKISEKLAPSPESHAGQNGGFTVLKAPDAMAVLRCPRFNFRPSQSDILHLDYWQNGVNILRDGGTYSYNSTDEDLAYFGGVKSHNTVEFDGRDQMPRLGRFLFGGWPKTLQFTFNGDQAEAAYKDYKGAAHKRAVKLSGRFLHVTDTLSGFDDIAILRWRLSPDIITAPPAIVKTGQGIKADLGDYEIEVLGANIRDAVWETGQESRYYLHKSPLLVLAITLSAAGRVETRLRSLT